MAKENDPSTKKIGEALCAMETLGISEEVVKPVLERLLKLYDHNWELIEENGYNTLAQAIFDLGDDKKIEANGAELNDNLVSEIKKPEVAWESNSTIEEPSCSYRNCEGSDDKASGMNKRIKYSTSSDSMSVVSQKQSICNPQGEVSCRIEDISNGAEKVSISLLDETGKAELPKFVYISKNAVYHSAFVQVKTARISDEDCCENCRGDCLSSVPCECTRQTLGVYAYTSEGLLKEDLLDAYISLYREPDEHPHYYCKKCPLEKRKKTPKRRKCKGHLYGKFVKECGIKCGCSMNCGNRVVQRGITRKLEVFMAADGKGWGFRTLEDLPKGAFVCEYVGEILTNNELNERNKKRDDNTRHTYPVLLDADWAAESVLDDDSALCLDATHYGNVGRFVNHRCEDANLIDIPVEVDIPDHHYYHVAFFTKRKVEAYEELTWDYGIDFDDRSHPIEAFKCFCGSDLCRDVNRKSKKRSKYTNLDEAVKCHDNHSDEAARETKTYAEGSRKSSRIRERMASDNAAETSTANEVDNVDMEEPAPKLRRSARRRNKEEGSE